MYTHHVHIYDHQAHAKQYNHTENCVVVAEGVFNTEGVFQVVALGFPPLEPRADSIAMLKVC